MKRTLRGLGIAAALLAPLGCPDDEGIQCTEIACDGGFDLWMTSTNTSTVYDAGRYDIIVEFGEGGDDGEVHIECNVDAAGSGSCDPADWVTASTEDMTVTAQFGLPAAQAVIETPAIQLHFEARTPAPAGGENLAGPMLLAVEVDRDTRKVGEQIYTPTYERDEELNGHVDCGFCDAREREILRLNP